MTRDDRHRGLRAVIRDAGRLIPAQVRCATVRDPRLGELLRRVERGRRRCLVDELAWLERQGGEEPAPVSPTPEPDRPAPAPAGSSSVDPRVLERRQVTPDLVVLRIEKPAGLDFIPGQSVKLGLEGVQHSYSIVSAPHEPFLEFFIEAVPGGRLSRRLCDLQVGDEVELRPRAKGGFVLDAGLPGQFFVATVTGVNPFVSMLRHHFARGDREDLSFVLLHGASFQDEFGYREELQALAAAHPEHFVYIPTVSRPADPRNQGWSGARGRVDSLVAAVLAEFGLRPDNGVAYACGNPGMVDTVSADLARRGFRVRSERYG